MPTAHKLETSEPSLVSVELTLYSKEFSKFTVLLILKSYSQPFLQRKILTCKTVQNRVVEYAVLEN